MFLRANPAEDWKKFGDIDPYYGVLSQQEFRSDRLTDEAKEKFFESGTIHVDKVMSVVDRLFPGAARGTALDFGCGTGRLAFALAAPFDDVVGVDIAQGMLEEATREAARRGISGVRFASSLDRAPFRPESYDFVHSYIVLQHIPTKTGYGILDDLCGALRPGGVGAIHLTHGEVDDSALGRLRGLVKDTIPLRILGNLAVGRAWNYPAMQMNRYDLSHVLKLLLARGIDEVTMHQVDDWGNLGVYLFFRRPEGERRPLWSNPKRR